MQFDPTGGNAVHIVQGNPNRTGVLIQSGPSVSYQQGYMTMEPGYQGAHLQGIPGTQLQGMHGAQLQSVPGTLQGVPGAQLQGIPSAQLQGVPGAQIGAQIQGIPGAHLHTMPGQAPGYTAAQSVVMPGQMSHEIIRPGMIPSQHLQGVSGAHIQGIPGTQIQGVPNVQGLQTSQLVNYGTNIRPPLMNNQVYMRTPNGMQIQNVAPGSWMNQEQFVKYTPQGQPEQIPTAAQSVQPIQVHIPPARPPTVDGQFSSPIHGIPLYSHTPLENGPPHGLPAGVQVVNVDAQGVAMQPSPAFVPTGPTGQPTQNQASLHPSIFQQQQFVGGMQTSQIVDNGSYSAAQTKPGIYIVSSVQKPGGQANTTVSNASLMSSTVLSTAVNASGQNMNDAGSTVMDKQKTTLVLQTDCNLHPNAMLQQQLQSPSHSGGQGQTMFQTAYVLSPQLQNQGATSNSSENSGQVLPSIGSFAAMASLGGPSPHISNESICLSNPSLISFSPSQNSYVASKCISQIANSSQSTISVTVTGTIATASLVTVASRIPGDTIVHSTLSQCQHSNVTNTVTAPSDKSDSCGQTLSLSNVVTPFADPTQTQSDSQHMLVNCSQQVSSVDNPVITNDVTIATVSVTNGPCVDNMDNSKSTTIANADSGNLATAVKTDSVNQATTFVTVPYGWQRQIQDDVIVYNSPDDTQLRSSEEMCQYLTRDDTCKCGLECPLLVDKVFSFDPNIQSKMWSLPDSEESPTQEQDLTKLCNHKRKILAMATLHNTTTSLQRQSDVTGVRNVTTQSGGSTLFDFAVGRQGVATSKADTSKKGVTGKKKRGRKPKATISQLTANQQAQSAAKQHLTTSGTTQIKNESESVSGQDETTQQSTSEANSQNKDTHAKMDVYDFVDQTSDALPLKTEVNTEFKYPIKQEHNESMDKSDINTKEESRYQPDTKIQEAASQSQDIPKVAESDPSAKYSIVTQSTAQPITSFVTNFVNNIVQQSAGNDSLMEPSVDTSATESCHRDSLSSPLSSRSLSRDASRTPSIGCRTPHRSMTSPHTAKTPPSVFIPDSNAHSMHMQGPHLQNSPFQGFNPQQTATSVHIQGPISSDGNLQTHILSVQQQQQSLNNIHLQGPPQAMHNMHIPGSSSVHNMPPIHGPHMANNMHGQLQPHVTNMPIQGPPPHVNIPLQGPRYRLGFPMQQKQSQFVAQQGYGNFHRPPNAQMQHYPMSDAQLQHMRNEQFSAHTFAQHPGQLIPQQMQHDPYGFTEHWPTHFVEQQKPKKKRATKKKKPKDSLKTDSLAFQKLSDTHVNKGETRMDITTSTISETTTSFLENPTAFMAQQTAIVNSTLPTTSPTYKTPPKSDCLTNRVTESQDQDTVIGTTMAIEDSETKARVDTRTELVKALEEDGLRKRVPSSASKAVAALTFSTSNITSYVATTASSSNTKITNSMSVATPQASLAMPQMSLAMGSQGMNGSVDCQAKASVGGLVAPGSVTIATPMGAPRMFPPGNGGEPVASGHAQNVIHGRYRLGAVTSQHLNDPGAFPASHMLSAAARANQNPQAMDQSQASIQNQQQMLLAQQQMPPGQWARFPTVANHIRQPMAMPVRGQAGMMHIPGVPPGQPREKSPIQMVQNMVSGLQSNPSHNALLTAMQQAENPRRRRKSTSSDSSGRNSVRIPMHPDVMSYPEVLSSDPSGRASAVRTPSQVEMELMQLQQQHLQQQNVQHQVVYDQVGNVHYQPVFVDNQMHASLATIQQGGQVPMATVHQEMQHPNVVIQPGNQLDPASLASVQTENGQVSIGAMQPGSVLLENGQIAQHGGVLVANAAATVVTTVAGGITQVIATSNMAQTGEGQQPECLPGPTSAPQLLLTGSQAPLHLSPTNHFVAPGATNHIVGPGGQLVHIQSSAAVESVQLVAHDPMTVANQVGSIATESVLNQSAAVSHGAGGIYAINPNVAMGTVNLATQTGNVLQTDPLQLIQHPNQTFALTQNTVSVPKTKSKKKGKTKAAKIVKQEPVKPVLSSTIAKILESAKREMEMKATGHTETGSDAASHEQESSGQSTTVSETIITTQPDTQAQPTASQPTNHSLDHMDSHSFYQSPNNTSNTAAIPEDRQIVNTNVESHDSNAIQNDLQNQQSSLCEQVLNSETSQMHESKPPTNNHQYNSKTSVNFHDIHQTDIKNHVCNNNGDIISVSGLSPIDRPPSSCYSKSSASPCEADSTDSQFRPLYIRSVVQHSHESYRMDRERNVLLNEARLLGHVMLSNEEEVDPHSDLFSTSYAIRTPRVFTSAKVRSAARILRKARMRKVKRSFPGQIGGLASSPPNCDDGHSNDLTSAMLGLDRNSDLTSPMLGLDRNSDLAASPVIDLGRGSDFVASESIGSDRSDPEVTNGRLKPSNMRIDKNFNSCVTMDALESPTHSNRDQSDDNDSAHLSNSEMDTSRLSQSSEGSGCSNVEGMDGSTDDSGINCDQRSEGEVEKGLKRSYEDDDELEDDAMSPVSPRQHSIGDLVWGRSRGFPSWPGKLVKEADVKHAVQRENGKLWVRWFGDHTVSQEEPRKLKTLSEGLEAHFKERQNGRKGRKLNTNLERAIQEAMTELDRQTSENTDERTDITDIKEHPPSSEKVKVGGAKKKKR